MAVDVGENHIFSQFSVRANFFRLILMPFLKRKNVLLVCARNKGYATSLE
jgi:hypothetical protein